MPRVHERTFRVRAAECDIHGVVRDANFLRYMETAAYDASAAAGYDRARYLALGRIWLIRETLLELHGELHLEEAVTVRTWVADFRRVRSRRAYELRHAATGALIATAVTDWAYLETATGRPAAIPPEMVAAFFPEGYTEAPDPRPRFPSAEPPATAFTHRRRVEWRDLDSAGHVNNAAYLDYVDEAARRHLAACGWPTARLAAAEVALAAQRHHIEYRHQALPDEELAVSTWLVSATPDAALRHTVIRRAADGELLAQARTAWGCVHPVTRRPVPIPEALWEALTPVERQA